MGPRVGLDGYGKTCNHKDSIPCILFLTLLRKRPNEMMGDFITFYIRENVWFLLFQIG